MKYILLILSFAILGGSQLQAQVPGYQGKRFFVELTGSFFPGFSNITAQNKGNKSFPEGEPNGIGVTLNDRYGMAVNYVLSHNTTFRLGYEYHVSGLFFSDITKRMSPITLSQVNDQRDLFYQLHAHDFNIHFILVNKMNNANLAPLGGYIQLGLRFVSLNGVLRDQRVGYGDDLYPDNIIRVNEVAPLDYNLQTLLVGGTVKYGYRTIVADKITLDAGIDATVFPQAIIHTDSGYQEAVRRSMSNRYILSIHLGIGYLLF